MSQRPIAWTIAGSDPSGGAGIQADVKTMNALGVHGCSVITALTAQNTTGVHCVEFVSPAMLQAQLEALSTDFPPASIKLGMLGTAETVHTVARFLRAFPPAEKPYVICDPIMASGSGQPLSDESAIQALISELLPYIDLLTPNRPEAECLTGRALCTANDMEVAARNLQEKGVQAVLIKGGHANNASARGLSQDYWRAGSAQGWLSSPRYADRNPHGTGCTLSAAIAACRALGMDLPDALVVAKAYINQGIRLSPHPEDGRDMLAHAGWPECFEDIPLSFQAAQAGWSTAAESGANRPEFPDCGPEPIGFYPIVPRASWLETLLPLGVRSIQLRVKDLSGDALEEEIARACAIAQEWDARLFINDYWELAIKHRAYGVHLGQSDLDALNPEDWRVLAQAGLRLGVSTHCYAEVSRALALRPSYLAIGPIFPTTTKVMRFAPQGLAALRRWRKTLPCPLVAIGGIFLDNAPEVLAQGADGIAVVRGILQASNVAEQTAAWLQLCPPAGAETPTPTVAWRNPHS